MMKYTYIHTILMFLFLIMGRVELVWGQFDGTGTEWGTYRNVVNTKDGETIVELTEDINMKGVILVKAGSTLKIISKKDVTIRNTGIMEPKELPNNPGRSRFFTVRGTLIIEGQEGATITLDGGADFTWDNYELKKGTNSRKLTEMIANEGTMTLKNVHIKDVNAEDEKNSDGKRLGNTTGGAIYISSGSDVPNGITKLENCKIEKCYAQLGSAIMISGHNVQEWTTLTPENCKVEIINSTITQCVSGGGDDSNSGGAIRTYGNTLSNLYLTNVTMTYNYAKRNANYDHAFKNDGNGGALFWNGRLSSETVCVMNGCLFEHNKCDDNGGAIKSQSSIRFEGETTTIQYNEAPNGGGLYIEGYIGGVQLGTARTLTYNLNDKLTVKNNTATTYQYEGINYPGKGAGVHFFLGEDMTLESGSTINVVMNGATIENNQTAGNDGLGGGIYYEDVAPQEKNYTFNINLNYGQIKNNTATAYGGGMYISKGNIVSEEITGKEMVIEQNKATISGGGIYLGEGTFTMANTGKIANNTATEADGGGVYVGGNFTMAKGNIERNQAPKGNGGGICLLNGTVNITSGNIQSNNCGLYGGGLYVYDSSTAEADRKKASFTGGTFEQNTALYGGGVCVDGNIDLTIGKVTIDKNTATNGGGICMLNGAGMDFGQGLIRYNTAKRTSTLSNSTAYKKKITEVNGIGGGIYLDSNTQLTFSVVNELGLYDNLADNGADDIFANGDGTSITLPEVANMNLSGFESAGKPYWVEDYITSDTEYGQGTCLKDADENIRRYRNSIKELKTIYKIEGDALTDAKAKYLCLALGHDIVYITIIKKGLAPGESAFFTIHQVDDKGTATEAAYRTVLLTGTSENEVSKKVALSTGIWLVKENTDWTWAYQNTTPSIQQVITNGTKFEFTNTKNTPLLHDEAKAENSMSGSGKNNEL